MADSDDARSDHRHRESARNARRGKPRANPFKGLWAFSRYFPDSFRNRCHCILSACPRLARLHPPRPNFPSLAGRAVFGWPFPTVFPSSGHTPLVSCRFLSISPWFSVDLLLSGERPIEGVEDALRSMMAKESLKVVIKKRSEPHGS